jgi:hypothetical protein
MFPSISSYVATTEKNFNIPVWNQQEDDLAAPNAAPGSSGVIQGVTVTDAVTLGATKYTITLEDPGAPSVGLSSVLNGTTLTVTLATDGGSVITSTTADVQGEIDGHSELSASGGDATLAVAETITLSRSGTNCLTSPLCVVAIRPVAATSVDLRIMGVARGQNIWDVLDGTDKSAIAEGTNFTVITTMYEDVFVDVTATDDTVDVLVGPGV